MKNARRLFAAVAPAIGILCASASIAHAQVVIKVNDNVNFRLGVLGQFQADTIRTTGTDVTATNLLARCAVPQDSPFAAPISSAWRL